MNVLRINAVLGCIFISVHVGRTANFQPFTLIEDLGNKRCPPSGRIASTTISGHTSQDGVNLCVHHCAVDVLCKSVFYNRVDFTCTKCNRIFSANSTLDDSTGTDYYVTGTKHEYYVTYPRYYQQACSTDNYCVEPNQECFTDKCICSPGYSYNPGTSTCVDSCVSYGSTFQWYPRRRILQDNMYIIYGLTLGECLNECIVNEMCVSVDYKPRHSTGCNLQNVTVKTTSTYLEEEAEYDYYARDCE